MSRFYLGEFRKHLVFRILNLSYPVMKCNTGNILTLDQRFHITFDECWDYFLNDQLVGFSKGEILQRLLCLCPIAVQAGAFVVSIVFLAVGGVWKILWISLK